MNKLKNIPAGGKTTVGDVDVASAFAPGISAAAKARATIAKQVNKQKAITLIDELGEQLGRVSKSNMNKLKNIPAGGKTTIRTTVKLSNGKYLTNTKEIGLTTSYISKLAASAKNPIFVIGLLGTVIGSAAGLSLWGKGSTEWETGDQIIPGYGQAIKLAEQANDDVLLAELQTNLQDAMDAADAWYSWSGMPALTALKVRMAKLNKDLERARRSLAKATEEGTDVESLKWAKVAEANAAAAEEKRQLDLEAAQAETDYFNEQFLLAQQENREADAEYWAKQRELKLEQIKTEQALFAEGGGGFQGGGAGGGFSDEDEDSALNFGLLR